MIFVCNCNIIVWHQYPGVAKFGIALGSGPRGRGFKSRHSDQKICYSVSYGGFFFTGLEGRAVQSNSPVDCCDRERPSDRSRANQVPPLGPLKLLVYQRFRRLYKEYSFCKIAQVTNK